MRIRLTVDDADVLWFCRFTPLTGRLTTSRHEHNASELSSSLANQALPNIRHYCKVNFLNIEVKTEVIE